MKKQIVVGFSIAGAVLLVGCLSPSQAQKKKAVKAPDGKQLFQQYCVKCHVGGGNEVKPKRPIVVAA